MMQRSSTQRVLSSILNSSEYSDELIEDAAKVERKRGLYSKLYMSKHSPHAYLMRDDIKLPNLSEWQQRVKIRIEKSSANYEQNDRNKNERLSLSVALAAIDFFDNTADILPEEPVIYAASDGELVAEFKARNGAITTIVSHDFIIIFADIDGHALHYQFTDRSLSAYEQIRSRLKEILSKLNVGEDGSLATTK